MARKVNPQEYAEKRNEILDAAQRLVFAKGYERMTIQVSWRSYRSQAGRSIITLTRSRP